MLKRFCNCCNKEIKDSSFYYTIKVYECIDNGHENTVFPIEELCESCNKDLSGYYRRMKLRNMGEKIYE